MSNVSMRQMLEAGVHFGHQTRRWNPKMKPYIFGARNGIYIIDLQKTVRYFRTAYSFIRDISEKGEKVLFVGTKRQSRGAIEQYAAEVGMPYVTERWLGGTLTNFRTIRERLKRLEELDRLVESGEMKNYSKKMESQLMRERKKIQRNLGGVRAMTRLPGALIVVDTNREKNALLEAKSLGIPTVCLVDTDGDPDLVNIPIPGNDDSIRSIELVAARLADAILEGKSHSATEAQVSAEGAEGEGEGAVCSGRMSDDHIGCVQVQFKEKCLEFFSNFLDMELFFQGAGGVAVAGKIDCHH